MKVNVFEDEKSLVEFGNLSYLDVFLSGDGKYYMKVSPSRNVTGKKPEVFNCVLLKGVQAGSLEYFSDAERVVLCDAEINIHR